MAKSKNQMEESELELVNLLKEFKAFSDLEKVIANLSSVTLDYPRHTHRLKSDVSKSQKQDAIGDIQIAINRAYETLNSRKPDSANSALTNLCREVRLIKKGLPKPDPNSQSGAKGSALAFFSNLFRAPPPASLRQRIKNALPAPQGN